jgi:hypothetical protein
MAEPDTETDTAPPPAAAPGAMSPDDITKLIHGLLAPSNTPVARAAPVDTESNAPTSWAGILGEHLAGGPPDVVDLTKAQRESAGRRALLNWSAGMMSVGPFDTLGQGLAAGTRAAQESQYTSEGLEAQRQVSAQDRQQQQVVNQINAATAAGPLMNVQLALARLKAMQGLPNPLAGGGSGTPGTTPGTSIAAVARDPKAGTAGQQGFNPGNVMADTGLPPGAIGRIPVAGGRYVAAFPDLSTGIAANAANLASYAANGVQTVADAVTRWVGDPKADLTSYIADVSRALGVKPDDKIDLTDPKVQSAFIMAQQPHESGKLWLTPDAVNQGVALAQTRRMGAPAPSVQAQRLGGTAGAGPAALPPPASTAPATATPAVMSPGELPGAAPPGGPPAAPPGGTTTAPMVPAPQAATMATPPPDASVPDDKLSWPQFQQRHMAPPSLADIQRITVTTDPKALADATSEVADARKAQATAAQTYQVGLSTGKLDDKATSDFNTANERVATANQNYNKLVQDAATSTAANMLAYQNKQGDILAKQYEDAKARAAAVALKTQEGQQAIELAHITAGTTLEQQQQKGEMDAGNKTLAEMGTQAVKADAIQPMLRQLIPLLKNPNAPSGVVGQFLTSHSDWLPMLQEMGVDPQTATVTSLVKGLTDFMSLDLKPTATGALRNQEIPMLKGLMPDLATSKPTQQQALARILNYTQRVKDEYDLASENFGNKDASGRPNYKILYKNIDAPMELDQNGRRVGGGLGAAVPEPPPMPADPRTATPGQTEAARRYNKYVSALPSGMPYNIYERQTDGSYQRVLKVRD